MLWTRIYLDVESIQVDEQTMPTLLPWDRFAA